MIDIMIIIIDIHYSSGQHDLPWLDLETTNEQETEHIDQQKQRLADSSEHLLIQYRQIDSTCAVKFCILAWAAVVD